MFYYAMIQDLEDGTHPMSIVSKNDYDEADAQLHYDMWYAKSQKDLFKSIKCLIINEQANVVKMDKWSKPVVLVAQEIEEPVEVIEEG